MTVRGRLDTARDYRTAAIMNDPASETVDRRNAQSQVAQPLAQPLAQSLAQPLACAAAEGRSLTCAHVPTVVPVDQDGAGAHL